jgi:hypothetical protein
LVTADLATARAPRNVSALCCLVCQEIFEYDSDICNIGNTDILLVRMRMRLIDLDRARATVAKLATTMLWRVTGTFFQKTISAGQIIPALLMRLQISSTKQFLIGLGVGGSG